MRQSQFMPDWLAKRALLSPELTALELSNERFSFAELEQKTAGQAVFFRTHGIKRGDRIALLAGNGAHFVWTIHAIARLGAIAVPLNVRLAATELELQMRDAEVRCLLHDSVHAEIARDLSKSIGIPTVSINRQIVPVSEQSHVVAPGYFDLDAVHTIIFTSGTTGRPKGAQLTYGNHWWSAIGSVLNLGLRPDDKWLACVPLFHVSGLSILMRSVIYGIPVSLHERFDPRAVNNAIDQDGVTIISVVSTMLTRMLDERGDRPYPSSLRCVLVGGGPVPPALLERCQRLGVPVVQTYGLSETGSQVVTLSPQDALRKIGSAGRPLFPVELRIEVDGRDGVPNEPGEIVIRGPNVMAGYYKRPSETAEVLQDGWLYTGDIGYLDDEGFLYVLDRRDDLFISGGENVYPAEIEAVLVAHEAVLDAAVIGGLDPMWGQVPVAFVALHAGQELDKDQLTAFCQKHLAPYKVPREFHHVTSLPRNASGKLLRRELRKQVTDQ